MSDQNPIDHLKKKLRKTARSGQNSPERVRLTLDQIAARVNNLIERRDPNASLPTSRHPLSKAEVADRRAAPEDHPTAPAHHYRADHVNAAAVTPRRRAADSNKQVVSSAAELTPRASRANAAAAVGSMEAAAHYISTLEAEVERLLDEREKICSMLYNSAARETRLELSSEEAALRGAVVAEQASAFNDIVAVFMRRLQLSVLRAADRSQQLSRQLEEEAFVRRKESPAIAVSTAQAVVLNDLKKSIEDAQAAIRAQVVQSAQRLEEAVCGKVGTAQSVISKSIEQSRAVAVNDVGELRRMLEEELDSRASLASSPKSPVESLKADRERDRLLQEQSASLRMMDDRVGVLMRNSERLPTEITKQMDSILRRTLEDHMRSFAPPAVASSSTPPVDEVIRLATADLLAKLRDEIQQLLRESSRQQQEAIQRRSSESEVEMVSGKIETRLDAIVASLNQQHHQQLSSVNPDAGGGSRFSGALLASLSLKFSTLVLDSMMLERRLVDEKVTIHMQLVTHVLRSFRAPVTGELPGPARGVSPRIDAAHHVLNAIELPQGKGGDAHHHSTHLEDAKQQPPPPPPPAVRQLLREFATAHPHCSDTSVATVYAAFAAPFVPTTVARRTPAKLANIAALKAISGIPESTPASEVKAVAPTADNAPAAANLSLLPRLVGGQTQLADAAGAAPAAQGPAAKSPSPPTAGSSREATSPKAARVASMSGEEPHVEVAAASFSAALPGPLTTETSFRNHSPAPLCPKTLAEAIDQRALNNHNNNSLLAPAQQACAAAAVTEARLRLLHDSSSSDSSSSSSSSSDASTSDESLLTLEATMSDGEIEKRAGKIKTRRSASSKKKTPSKAVSNKKNNRSSVKEQDKKKTSRPSMDVVSPKSPSPSSLSLDSIDDDDLDAPAVTGQQAKREEKPQKTLPPKGSHAVCALPTAAAAKIVSASEFDEPSPEAPACKPLTLENSMSVTDLPSLAALRVSPEVRGPTPSALAAAQRRSSFDSLASLPTPVDGPQPVPISDGRTLPKEKSLMPAASLQPSSLSLPPTKKSDTFSLEERKDDEKNKKKVALPTW
jgi:hypothetical protein